MRATKLLSVLWPVASSGKPRKPLREMAGKADRSGCPRCNCVDVRRRDGKTVCRHCGRERPNA
jgi:hypothetical protein